MPDAPSTKTALRDLWTRIEDFCLERGWDVELFVRQDAGNNFGRVGARVIQPLHSFQAFGNTSNEAIRNLALGLEREGFDA